MNIQKGFRRLAIVLSILSWLSLFLLEVSNRGPHENPLDHFIGMALFAFMIGVIPIWLVYFIIKFIVSGFKS
jgi:hypothetical protein